MDHFLMQTISGLPLLLLVDGHCSHYDETNQFAKEIMTIIFCFPPHVM